jgi:hypothetical protein
MNYIVEGREPNGSWYTSSSHGSEIAAISMAERDKRNHPQRLYRVKDSKGNVTFIV